MATIHPTAIIEDGAKLGEGVIIGPYCTIGAEVSLGAGSRLVSHVVITGKTMIGQNNVIYPFASLGQPSPDRKYKGEAATLTVGDNNDIREGVTMHIGTGADKGTTTVGSNNLFMAGSHVAHDCVVGSNVIIANYTQLAGHVEIADNVTIGGLSGIHQHVRVGNHAIIGGHTAVDHDVPPYASVSGRRATLKGLNLVGLRRRGFEKTLIRELDDAYDFLFDESADNEDMPLTERATKLKRRTKTAEVKALAEFVLSTHRGLTGYDEDE
ncbi:MAG: acyl-[acyl-carrier-protein]--UDP-N-acetylglucosamine O-acyltransferase [Pseudomonas fluorescens]|nr:MAG: acyl-[acyl-carrier-protein]--UDP-N-acetylglucosamine O-acyltransferase [Pseudomonas fluorescens]